MKLMGYKRKSYSPFTTLTKMKTKKVVLWGLLIGNGLIGLFILFLWLTGELKLQTVSKGVGISHNQAVSDGSKAFATHFAVDYFNWTLGQEQARAKRLQAYLPKEMDVQGGLQFSSLQWEARPGAAQVWSVENQGVKQSVITIMINVTYYNPKNNQDYFMVKRWLAVSVQAIQSDRFIVNQIPYVIPSPPVTSAKLTKEEIQGKEVDSSTQKQLQGTLRNFFDVYSRGNEGEIRYLSRSQIPIRGYQGTMKLLSLDSVRVVQSGSDYYAYSTVHFQETDTHTEVVYPYEIRLRKEQNQWFIYDLTHH